MFSPTFGAGYLYYGNYEELTSECAWRARLLRDRALGAVVAGVTLGWVRYGGTAVAVVALVTVSRRPPQRTRVAVLTSRTVDRVAGTFWTIGTWGNKIKQMCNKSGRYNHVHCLRHDP